MAFGFSWSVVVTEPREEAPLTLDDVRAHCTKSEEEHDDDGLLDSYRLAAADVVERLSEVPMGTQTCELTATRFPDEGDAFRLPLPPLQEDSVSVEYRDANGVLQTWDPDLYDVVTRGRFGAIVPKVGECYPVTRCGIPDAVVVTFDCGYASAADVPRRYLQAMRLLVAHWYANREAVNVGNLTSMLPLGFDLVMGAPARLDPCC